MTEYTSSLRSSSIGLSASSASVGSSLHNLEVLSYRLLTFFKNSTGKIIKKRSVNELKTRRLYDAERNTVKAQYNKPLRFNSDKAINTLHLIYTIMHKRGPFSKWTIFLTSCQSLHLIYLTNEENIPHEAGSVWTRTVLWDCFGGWVLTQYAALPRS